MSASFYYSYCTLMARICNITGFVLKKLFRDSWRSDIKKVVLCVMMFNTVPRPVSLKF